MRHTTLPVYKNGMKPVFVIVGLGRVGAGDELGEVQHLGELAAGVKLHAGVSDRVVLEPKLLMLLSKDTP